MSIGKHRRRGLTLIEVLVAMGVTAVGILALMAVFITGTRSNQHGADLSRATYYARKITELVRQDGLAFSFSTIPPNTASGLNDPDNVFRAIDAEPPANTFRGLRVPLLNEDGTPKLDGTGAPVRAPADVKFQRNIQTRRASTVSTDYRYPMLIMDVSVRWQGGKVGDGMRHVKITSLLKST